MKGVLTHGEGLGGGKRRVRPMFELIAHAISPSAHVQQLLGMGRPVMQDWSDDDDSAVFDGNAVRDSTGATVCYEYTSIYTHQVDTQQWGCRGQFPGSQFERVGPAQSGRAVCGDRAWGSDVARAGCGNWAQTGWPDEGHWRSAQPSWPGTHHRTM